MGVQVKVPKTRNVQKRGDSISDDENLFSTSLQLLSDINHEKKLYYGKIQDHHQRETVDQ
jgi:hypothetical protein